MDNRELFSILFGICITGKIIVLVGTFVRLFSNFLQWAAVATGLWDAIGWVWGRIKAHWKLFTCLLVAALASYAVLFLPRLDSDPDTDNGTINGPLQVCVDRTIGTAFETVDVIAQDLAPLGQQHVPALGAAHNGYRKSAVDFLVEKQRVFVGACNLKFSIMPAYIVAGRVRRAEDEDLASWTRSNVAQAVEHAQSCHAAWAQWEEDETKLKAEMRTALAVAEEEKARWASGAVENQASVNADTWIAELATESDVDGVIKTLRHAMRAADALGTAYATSEPCMLDAVNAVNAAFNKTRSELTGQMAEKTLRKLAREVHSWQIVVAVHDGINIKGEGGEKEVGVDVEDSEM